MEINGKTFELKAIKHAEFASEETNCYHADLYVDGRKFCHVHNDGHGGCDMQDPIPPNKHADIEALNAWCKENIPKKIYHNLELDFDLECICNDLLAEWMLRKDFMKATKKSILFLDRPGETAIYETKVKGGMPKIPLLKSLLLEKFKKQHPERIVLNDMDPEEAFKIFRAGME